MIERMRLRALILFAITLFSTAIVRADDAAAINKLIADINAAAKTNKARMMKIIVINTDVAATTLESEKSRTGLSLGDVYVAHSLGLASHKSFDQIVALQKGGQSWGKIAQTHKVSLKGSTAALREMLKE
jgi:PIN domain nuclease of toxin-antitoxin system